MNGEKDHKRNARLNAKASNILRNFAFSKLSYDDGFDVLSACVATLVFNIQIEDGDYGKHKKVGLLAACRKRDVFALMVDDMLAQLRDGSATIEKDAPPKSTNGWGKPSGGEDWSS